MMLTMKDNWGDTVEIVSIGAGDIEVRFRGAGTMELSPSRVTELIALLRTVRDEVEASGARIH